MISLIHPKEFITICCVFLCSRYPERRGEGEEVNKGCCQKESERCVCDLGEGADPLSEGRKQTLCIQSSHELCSHGDEEPACCAQSSRFIAEEHRSHESYAKPSKNPRNPSNNEGLVQRDDEDSLRGQSPWSSFLQAGIIEEMLEDTFEGLEDQEEMEEEAEAEIDKILFEITAGALGKAPSKVTDALPEPEPMGAAAAAVDEEEDIEAMQSRLATLRS
uniref:Uncharacterized protein n=1 Tax=Catharus ustulatus TaxID=91951 RepID=A0A8C3XZI6_CATUS